MCRKLLANTVIENYRIEREESGGVKSAVIVFPGSNCDRDLAEALRLVTGRAPAMVWHRESELAGRARPGRHPRRLLLRRLSALGRDGGAIAGDAARSRRRPSAASPVLGICNGFQVLTEARLLPGALMRNAGIRFVCRDVPLKVENSQSAFTARYEAGEEIVIPVAHHDGNYQADDGDARPARGRGPRRLPLCRRGQRLGARHRRHPQRGRQRARHDAPPRADGGAGPWRHRRPAAVRGAAGERSPAQPSLHGRHMLAYNKPAYYMRPLWKISPSRSPRRRG